MASNKNKIDQLHDQLPSHFNTRNNTNWKAVVDALGQADQETADLVAEVRKQFFVKTASRPYLDRLAANNKIARPKFVGMDDPSFRQYIPVLSYQPKQVKHIIDQLLDIFFFKESTTAFMTSELSQLFHLQDGWELSVLVDELNLERIEFKQSEFTDINNATANEIVAAINRQTKWSYATANYDSISKNTFIRMFTNTIGSKGSLRVVGGRANTAIRFDGFLNQAGNGFDTQWSVTKIGDETTFQHIGGTAPGIDQLQVGDIVIIDLPGNSGSFPITNINLTSNKFSFINLFSTIGTFTQTNNEQVKFLRSVKHTAYLNPRRAMTWETKPGEITVEMPTSPPVVKRSLKGSIHVNGAFSQMTNRDSNTSLTISNAYQFPESGTFVIEAVNELMTRIITQSENTVLSKKMNTRLQFGQQTYEYASRVALTTTGNLVEGQAQITGLASTVGLEEGQQVLVDGVPAYARVISISGSNVNISFPSSVDATSVTIKFLGNTLTGITPSLPMATSLNEFTISSIVRTTNIVTVTTSSPHNYSVGDIAIINGSSGLNILTTIGDITSGSNIITNLASTSGLEAGMLVFAAALPANTKIVDVIGNSVVIDQLAASTDVGATITFNEDINSGFKVETVGSNTFTFTLDGPNNSALTPGDVRVEKAGLSNSGSKIIVTDAISNQISRITGAYIWDLRAPFTLSSSKATTIDPIQAGKIIRLLVTSSNPIPDSGGYVIFDYGKNNQEGPVRFLYKPTDNTIALDPSYTFKHSHPAGSSIVYVSHKGPHEMSTHADEYPAYITDPSEARFILEDLIRSVKSAGIFVNFLVRYPEQLYATLDVYQSGTDPG